MAKVIQNERSVVVEPWGVKGRLVFIGRGMGLVWWVLTALLRQYVVEPFACRDLSAAATCVNAIGVSGSIAAVLVAVLGAYVLVRNIQPRPIIIAVATAVLLWDLGTILRGLGWWETLLWALFLYTACYVLFSFVSRIAWLAASLTLAAVIVVIIRILLVL